MTPPHSTTSSRGAGVVYSALSYVLWGLVPLYFLLLEPMGAHEIVGWRVIFSLVVVLIIAAVVRAWRDIGAILRNPRLMALAAVAAAIIFLNWWLFTVAATTGNVLEASLGYFITPIVSVVLGVVFLKESVRPLQWVAFGLSALAVVVLAVLYGEVPWMALAMALTFGLYGFVKKLMGARVDAVSGLVIETAWTVPMALALLAYVGATTGIQYGTLGVANTWFVPLSGLVTALPLLLFAAGTRRVPMVYIGMLQFIEPIIQFLTGALLLGEPMPPERLLGFGFVWAAVVLLVLDSLAQLRSRVRARRVKPGIPTTHTGPLQRIETAEIRFPRQDER